MLKPAILFKNEIQSKMKEWYYTDDMMFETGCLDNWYPDIPDCPDGSLYQYAIVDKKENCIGFLSYYIDWYSDNVSRFGLFSFDRGNPLVGRDLFSEMEKLVKRHHRVEWRMVGGNPVEKSYDNFCKMHNGNKVILHDVLKDRDGNYHDDVIYEIIKR